MSFRACCFVVVALLAGARFSAADEYLGEAYHTCMRNSTTGVISNSFKQNLGTALRNLTSLATNGTMYAISSQHNAHLATEGPVYAMFQCRGDQTREGCATCVANATAQLQSECPASIGARIQLDGCFVRYDNQSFFTPDFGFVIAYCFATSSDPIALAAIQSIMDNVTTLAPLNGGFATASATANGEYALAQCLGYLNETECSDCLSQHNYRTVCDSTLGQQLHLTSCYYRYEPYPFFNSAQSPPAPPPPPPRITQPPPRITQPATPTTQPKPGSKTLLIVACVIAIVVFAMATLGLMVAWRYNFKKVKGEKNYGMSIKMPILQPRCFTLHELEVATQYYHVDNKLGEGGFGPVYKGTLPNGENIAVKKLSAISQQGRQEFLNEVSLITSVQHRNLVKLLGSSVEGPEKILVYEYLRNRSLDCHLFDDGVALDWPTRFAIINGMARGLAYLHEESQVRIIHRDIKPSNILLDDQLNPVIADFGLARLFQDQRSHVNTRVAGTVGYLAPEYAIHGELSEKVDVYSFGIVSLEIISGRKILNSRLLESAWGLYLQNNPWGLVDPILGDNFSPVEVERIVHVALLCTQENPKRRPCMSAVGLLLGGTSEIADIPIKPGFVDPSSLGGA